MNDKHYQDILRQVTDIRENSWPEDRPDVPQTLPVGPALGEEMTIPLEGRDIRVLVHRPKDGRQRHPVYFNFHGGGMSAGTPEQDEFLCVPISERAGCLVVNVEYRLAPEHPFPHGVNDAYDTICYMLEHAAAYGIDTGRVAVGGYSAGACLAAACSILANRQKRFAYQGVVLCYAGLKFFQEENKVPGAVVKSTAKLYEASYAMGGGDLRDPLASPVMAGDGDLRDTPGALIMPASLDALKPDSDRYAQKLAGLGVPVVYKCFMNCVHGFTHRGYKEEPWQAVDMIVRYLKTIWS